LAYLISQKFLVVSLLNRLVFFRRLVHFLPSTLGDFTVMKGDDPRLVLVRGSTSRNRFNLKRGLTEVIVDMPSIGELYAEAPYLYLMAASILTWAAVILIS